MVTSWPFAPQFFGMNRQRLVELMDRHSIAILFSNDQMPRNGDQFFPFRQNSNFFHQTGIVQEKSILLLFPDSPIERLREVLFIMRFDASVERWEGTKLTADRARGISGVRTVLYLDEFESVLREAAYFANSIFLSNSEQVKFHSEVVSRSVRAGLEIMSKYPYHTFRRLDPLLTRLRVEKCDSEIAVIRDACLITAGAFKRVVSMLKPGVTEYEIQAEIEHEFRIRQAAGHAFHPIIASGLNATYLHYNKNQDICEDGDLLLMDFGCEYFGYASDLSRTVPVNGNFTPRQREIYNAVLDVFKFAKPLFVVGNTIDYIQKEVIKMMEEKMIQLGLFGRNDIKQQDSTNPLYLKYFPHGVSHHIGLDVHDPGSKHEPLKSGMVLTLEPGIYIPNEQIGIRIETDLLVTDGAPVDLFDNLEIEPEDIESLFRN